MNMQSLGGISLLPARGSLCQKRCMTWRRLKVSLSRLQEKYRGVRKLTLPKTCGRYRQRFGVHFYVNQMHVVNLLWTMFSHAIEINECSPWSDYYTAVLMLSNHIIYLLFVAWFMGGQVTHCVYITAHVKYLMMVCTWLSFTLVWFVFSFVLVFGNVMK